MNPTPRIVSYEFFIDSVRLLNGTVIAVHKQPPQDECPLVYANYMPVTRTETIYKKPNWLITKWNRFVKWLLAKEECRIFKPNTLIFEGENEILVCPLNEEQSVKHTTRHRILTERERWYGTWREGY